MVATLQSRKEALEAKILEKNEELKKLCLQEADLTGVMPPEIPLEPGEPPPPIRRRVGTSFSFPQNLINNVKDADDESLTALELECKVQTNIAEAALALANDSSANKAARRKHRLMYRQSQRRLMELETRLNLLKQGKSQQFKSQQIKKKPRPNTTAVENLGFLFKKSNDQNRNYFSDENLGSWHGKNKQNFPADDGDRSKDFIHQNEVFGSLQRSVKSGGTSQSSNSPRTDISTEEYKLGTQQLFSCSTFPNYFVPNSISHPNIQEVDSNKLNVNLSTQQHKKIGKIGITRRQWDTQSAGGTLLPSQTYPDHSHHPNLNRTQSLGSVESSSQKSKDSWSMQDFQCEDNAVREKEWYETSLDSAPSPPLRTTSRLPSTARMLYQMQEIQQKDMTNWNGANITGLRASTSHSTLPATPNMIHKSITKSSSAYTPSENRNFMLDNLSSSMQQMHLSPQKKGKTSTACLDESRLNQKDLFYNYGYNEGIQSLDFIANTQKSINESMQCQNDGRSKSDLPYSSALTAAKFMQPNECVPGVPLTRQNSLGQAKYKTNNDNDQNSRSHDNIPLAANNSLYINILENKPNKGDEPSQHWLSEEEFPNQIKSGHGTGPQEFIPKPQTPTQPYYHVMKPPFGEKIKNLQYQAAKNRQASISEEQIAYKPPSPLYMGTHHPPQAIVQNEISFDTVVPFESPQNHTVVQAGKWQPYREVTKPFEMSDFYKYSTKFRQNQAQSNQAATSEVSTNLSSATHQKGVYTPLKPMTCKPVESKISHVIIPSHADVQCDELEKTLVEVSPPEIV